MTTNEIENSPAKIICEACGSAMKEWNISAECALFCCPECLHIKRDREICNAQSREHAWGGDAFFDKIRILITLKRLEKKLPSKKLNVLEVGFGSGKMLASFLEEGHNVSGVEAEMLETRIDERLKNKAELYFGKIEEINLPEEKFDLIYGVHLIEHLENPALFFEKCFRSLKKGGMLYFLTPNADSAGLKVFKDKWWNLEDPTHIRFFTPRSAEIMLKSAGLQKVKTSVPLWDSLTVEVNSLMRFLKKDSEKHGVLNSKAVKLLDLFLLPFFLLLRIIYPKISPTLEIIAHKAE